MLQRRTSGILYIVPILKSFVRCHRHLTISWKMCFCFGAFLPQKYGTNHIVQRAIMAPFYRPTKSALGGWRSGSGITRRFISQESVILISYRT